MNKKRLFFISLAFFGVFIAIIGYIIVKSQSTPTTPFTIKVPNISSPVDVQNKVVLEIDETDFAFPKQAALLKVSPLPPVTTQESQEVAKNLNFTNNPIISKDVDLGELHIYNSNKDSLVIYLDPNIFNYSLNAPLDTVDKQLSDDEIIAISKNFLTDNFLIDPSSIDFVNFNYKKATQVSEGIYTTSKTDADFVQVNFSPIVNDLAIITLDPDSTPYYVWMLSDGTIHATNIKKLGNISETSEVFDLKNFNEVNNSLDSAKLISLDQGNVHLPDINSQYIKSITISEIELAYLFPDANSDLLQPIYILRGRASLINPLKEVDAVLYMPAIIEP